MLEEIPPIETQFRKLYIICKLVESFDSKIGIHTF